MIAGCSSSGNGNAAAAEAVAEEVAGEVAEVAAEAVAGAVAEGVAEAVVEAVAGAGAEAVAEVAAEAVAEAWAVGERETVARFSAATATRRLNGYMRGCLWRCRCCFFSCVARRSYLSARPRPLRMVYYLIPDSGIEAFLPTVTTI